jgi:hypothetical protein
MKNGLSYLVLGLLLSPLQLARAVWVMPEELAEARQWSVAKFEGQQLQRPAEPALVALANRDPVRKNARGGKPVRIVDQSYTLNPPRH